MVTLFVPCVYKHISKVVQMEEERQKEFAETLSNYRSLHDADNDAYTTFSRRFYRLKCQETKVWAGRKVLQMVRKVTKYGTVHAVNVLSFCLSATSTSISTHCQAHPCRLF